MGAFWLDNVCIDFGLNYHLFNSSGTMFICSLKKSCSPPTFSLLKRRVFKNDELGSPFSRWSHRPYPRQVSSSLSQNFHSRLPNPLFCAHARALPESKSRLTIRRSCRWAERNDRQNESRVCVRGCSHKCCCRGWCGPETWSWGGVAWWEYKRRRSQCRARVWTIGGRRERCKWCRRSWGLGETRDEGCLWCRRWWGEKGISLRSTDLEDDFLGVKGSALTRRPCQTQRKGWSCFCEVFSIARPWEQEEIGPLDRWSDSWLRLQYNSLFCLRTCV